MKVNDLDTLNEFIKTKLKNVSLQLINPFINELYNDRVWGDVIKRASANYRLELLDYFVFYYYLKLYRNKPISTIKGQIMNLLKSRMTRDQVKGSITKILDTITAPSRPKQGMLNLIERDTFSRVPIIINNSNNRNSLYHTLPRDDVFYVLNYDDNINGLSQKYIYEAWVDYMIKTYKSFNVKNVISPDFSNIHIRIDEDGNVSTSFKHKNRFKKRIGFFVSPVSISSYTGASHVTMLFIEKGDRQDHAFLFDPNGNTPGLTHNAEHALSKELKQIDSRIKLIRGFFERIQERGPQDLEGMYGNSISNRGYCFIWVLLFSEYVIKYPNEDLADLYKKILFRGDLRTLIKRYLTHLMNITLDKNASECILNDTIHCNVASSRLGEFIYISYLFTYNNKLDYNKIDIYRLEKLIDNYYTKDKTNTESELLEYKIGNFMYNLLNNDPNINDKLCNKLGAIVDKKNIRLYNNNR